MEHQKQPNHPRHSTPVKKYGNSGYSDLAHNGHNVSSASGSGGVLSLHDLEATTVEKQRKELQLLITELKDRDKELNDMVAAHHHQLAAWERDRQRVMILEKRNEQYEAELKKRHEQLRLLIQRLKVSETKHKSKDNALETSHVRLKQLEKNVSTTSYEVQDLRDKNSSLNTSMSEMTSKMTRLETREQELMTLLRTKERELGDVTDHVSSLGSKIRCIDAELQDAKRSEAHYRTELQEERSRNKQGKLELDNLKAEMIEKTSEMLSYRRDIAKLKDEIHKLQKEIQIRDEQLRRKDELIELQRSKQDRADRELAALRQIYESQQKELSTLHMSLSESQELLEKQEERLNDMSNFEMNGLLDDDADCCSDTTNELLDEARRSTTPAELPDKDGPVRSKTPDMFHSSPTSRLQRLLAESREMVHNLERAALTPVSRPHSARTPRDKY